MMILTITIAIITIVVKLFTWYIPSPLQKTQRTKRKNRKQYTTKEKRSLWFSFLFSSTRNRSRKR
jgi:hypothetical protein